MKRLDILLRNLSLQDSPLDLLREPYNTGRVPLSIHALCCFFTIHVAKIHIIIEKSTISKIFIFF